MRHFRYFGRLLSKIIFLLLSLVYVITLRKRDTDPSLLEPAALNRTRTGHYFFYVTLNVTQYNYADYANLMKYS